MASNLSRSVSVLRVVNNALCPRRGLASSMCLLKQNDRDIPAHISLPDTYTGMIQSAQGREHEFSAWRAKDTVDVTDVSEFEKDATLSTQTTGTTEAGVTKSNDNHTQHYDDSCQVSLHSVMQSNVPEPYSRGNPTHLNMPGSGNNQRQKMESGRQTSLFDLHKRHLHTSAVRQTVHSINEGVPPAAQGVQGDDCVLHKLFMSNCLRYNLDCDEMLQGIQTGRRTLAEVFAEQENMIRAIAEAKSSAEGDSPKPKRD